jgi:type IV pilus assembly protein PilV
MNRQQRGFTLVEALIGLVLLSLGLLGACAMSLGSLRSHADALREITARHLLQDITDRIRANPRAGAGYDTRETTPGGAGCVFDAPCSPRELAAADLAHFLGSARRLLPGTVTSASIEYEPAIGPAAADRYAITLSWRGSRDDEPRVVATSLLAPPVAG